MFSPIIGRTSIKNLRIRRMLCLTVMVLISGLSASAKIIYVDDNGGPGIDYTDLDQAVFEADDGDIIIVAAGTYDGFKIYTGNKGLTILAKDGERPQVTEAIWIDNLKPDKRFVISGFSLWELYFRWCDGQVKVDDCIFDHFHIFSGPFQIVECELAFVSRTHVISHNGYTGITVNHSNAIFSECSFKGARGGDNPYGPGYDGSAGLGAEDSMIFLQASSAYGGAGGDGGYDPYGFWYPGGDGAPAIYLEDSHLELFGLPAHKIEGGIGGLGDPTGNSGNAVYAENSNVYYSGVTFKAIGVPVFDGVNSQFLEVSPEVPVITLEGTGLMGDTITAVLTAPQGAYYAFYFSPFDGIVPLGNMITQLLLDPGHLYFLVSGIIPPGDQESFAFLLPDSNDLFGVSIHFQSFVSIPSGTSYLSTSVGFVLR